MGGKILKRFVPMVAIDVATKQEAIDLFDKLMVKPQPIVKIGMERSEERRVGKECAA